MLMEISKEESGELNRQDRKNEKQKKDDVTRFPPNLDGIADDAFAR